MFCSNKRKSSRCTCKPACKGPRRIRGQPRNKSLRRKLQYLFQPDLCCDKTCSIFGALDKPYHGAVTSHCFHLPKRSKDDINSLGVPVGLICSNVPIQSTKNPSVQLTRLDIYVRAFGLIYLLPENKWTESNIDDLLNGEDVLSKQTDCAARPASLVSFLSHTTLDASELKPSKIALNVNESRLKTPQRLHGGRTLSHLSDNKLKKFDQKRTSRNRAKTNLRSSFSNESFQSTVESEVFYRAQSYGDSEQTIARKFTIKNHEFTVEVQPVFCGTKETTRKSKTIILHLRIFLRDFFQKYRYCLFWTESFGYLLIWRRRRAYFVLDVNGRERSQLKYADRKKTGVAMLLCLKTLDNVIYLISRLSDVSMTDLFQLRHLIVTRLETPTGKLYIRDTNTREMDYNVVSNDYAYLKSQLHLTFNPHDHLRNRSSVMVGVAAIIAAKIDHPATWNTTVFDRIMCHGVKICRNCWESCTRHSIDLDTFPTQLRIGQFVAELKLLPSVKSGHWRCSKPFTGNEYERILIGALDEYKSVLFQINNQMYAIWVSHDFYYLLDPFLHIIREEATEENEKPKSASLRMFRDKMLLLQMFHAMLIESNRSSTFYIHAVKIKNLQPAPYGFALIPVAEDSSMDVVSLNETICFPSDYQECIDQLSQVSDYELDVVSFTDKPIDFDADVDVEDDLSEEMEENESDMEGIEMSDDMANKKNKSKTKKESNLKSKSKSSLKSKSQKRRDSKTMPSKTVKSTPPNEHVQQIKGKQNIDNGHHERTNDAVESVVNHDDEFEKERKRFEEKSVRTDRNFESIDDKSKQYPGYSKVPQNMAVCGSESGTIESLTRLLRSAFKCAERVLMLTPWGNHVVFRDLDRQCKTYYVFQGCVCNIDHFRHMDLRFGTAGLKPFQHQCHIVRYIIDSRETNALDMLRTRLDLSSQCLETLKARGP